MASDRVRLPVVAVRRAVDESLGMSTWPGSLPCVRQVLQQGMELGPLTILVGENGTGKSTLVEAIAQCYGLSPEGGSSGARHSTRASESPLWKAIELRRGIGASRWGFFLRAETMHGFYSYLEANPGRGGADPVFHEMSHGESFLQVLATRFANPGFYVLDEPESALSFTASLALVGLLGEIARSGVSQAVVATHSPILAATPGARLLEVTSDGLTERSWEELELVANWRAFLTRPDQYLHHLHD